MTNETFGICNISMLLNDFSKSLRTYRLYQLSDIEVYLYTIIRIIIIIIGDVANCALLHSVLRQPKVSLTSYDVFVANVAVTNFVILTIGESGVVLQNISHGDWLIGDMCCRIYLFVHFVPSSFAMVFHVLLSVDRIMKIGWSSHILTVRRARIASACTWIVVVMVGVRSIPVSRSVYVSFGNCEFNVCRYDYYDPAYRSETGLILEMVISFVLPFIVVVALNIAVLYILIRHIRNAEKRQPEQKTRNVTMKEIRAVKSILKVGLVLMVCWLDFLVIAFVGMYVRVPVPVKRIGRLLGISYSAVIPFLFGSGYPNFIKRRVSVTPK